MNRIVELFTEQTTADQTVIFLLLGTFFILVICLVAYALLLLLLSRWRMPQEYTVWQLLLPSGDSIRRYSAEYLLSGFTALLLALTVAVRHEMVEEVLSSDISQINHQLVSSALPMGPPLKAHLVAAGANGEQAQRLIDWMDKGTIKKVSVSFEGLLRALLESGLKVEANSLLSLVVDSAFTEKYSRLLKRVLLLAATILLIAYVGWFSVQRWKKVRTKKAGDPDYAEIIKRLSLPAVCITLLLASAVTLPDKQRLINSALARAAMIPEPTDQTLEPALAAVVNKQVSQPTDPDSLFNPEDLDAINSSIRNLSERVNRSRQKISELESQLSGLDKSMDDANKLHEDFSAEDSLLLERSTTLGGQLTSLTTRFDQHLEGFAEATQKEMAPPLQKMQQQIDQNRRNTENTLATTGKLERQVELLSTDVDKLKRELQRLAALIEKSGSNKGLALVLPRGRDTSYTIHQGPASGPTVVTDKGVGLHMLAAGRYTVRSPGSQARSISLSAERPQVVQLISSKPGLQIAPEALQDLRLQQLKEVQTPKPID